MNDLCQRGLLSTVTTLLDKECANHAWVTANIPSWSNIFYTFPLCKTCFKELVAGSKAAHEQYVAERNEAHRGYRVEDLAE